MERREFIKIAGLGTLAITFSLGISTTKGIILRFPSGEEHKIKGNIKGGIVVPVARDYEAWGGEDGYPLYPIFGTLIFSDSGVIENGWRIYKA